jgi:hypothetical protein
MTFSCITIVIVIEFLQNPTAVTHSCDSSYTEGGDLENGHSRSARAKNLEDSISVHNLGMVACIWYRSNMGMQRKDLALRPALGKNARPYLKNKYEQRGLAMWLYW